MRPLTTRKAKIIASILTLAALGTALGWRMYEQSRVPRPKPELLEVAFYQAVHTGFGLRVIVPECAVQSVSRDYHNRLMVTRWSVSKAEMDSFRQLVDSAPGLRTFNPRSWWFKECRHTDCGAAIAFTWSDRTRTYAFLPPPDCVRMLPPYAKVLYKRMDEVFEKKSSMIKGKPKTVREITQRDPVYLENKKRRMECYELSLPRNRCGW